MKLILILGITMLIISQEEFLKELASSKSNSISISEKLSKDKYLEDNIENETPNIPDEVKLESHTYDNFRKSALPNIPKELKAVVGALGTLESHQDVADTFGVSKQTVANLSNDNHSNAIVSETKVNILERVKTNTISKIDKCVEFIEVLKGMNNKELLATAESLSRINRNITPVSQPTEGNNVQFIYYAPSGQDAINPNDIIDAST